MRGQQPKKRYQHEGAEPCEHLLLLLHDPLLAALPSLALLRLLVDVSLRVPLALDADQRAYCQRQHDLLEDQSVDESHE